jgi:alkylated DNA nucleotide flippase Atl1
MSWSEQYVAKATDILEDIARIRAGPITYGELAKAIGIAPRSVGGVLVPISNKSSDSHHVLLSVLVVAKKTGLPSERFFVQAKELSVMRDDELPQIFFRAELTRVYDAYNIP